MNVQSKEIDAPMKLRRYFYSAALIALLALGTGCAHFSGQTPRRYWGKPTPVRKQGQAYAHHLAGVFHERQGNLMEALESWEKLLALDPETQAPRIRMIRVYLSQGNFKKAIATCEEILQRSPEIVEFWVILGEMKYASGDIDGAVQSFEKAIELKPDNMLGYGALVELQEKTNDLVAAIEIYEKLIKNSPDSAALYYQLGINLSRINDHKGAFEAFTKVLELEPKITLARLFQAIHLHELGSFEESKDAFYLYLAERPNDPQALQRLTGTLLRLRRIDEARQILYRLLDHKDAEAKNMLQWALFQGMEMSFFSAAVAAMEGNAPFLAACYNRLDQSTTHQPGRQDKVFISFEELDLEGTRIQDALQSMQHETLLAEALISQLSFFQDSVALGNLSRFLQGRLLIYLDRPAEALDLLNQIHVEGNEQKYVLYHRALACEMLGDKENTEVNLLAYLVLDPQDPVMLNFLGYFYAEENKHLEEALQLLNLALAISPEDPFYLDSLGWIYYRLGDYTKAEELVRKAIYGMDADDAILRDHLGDIYQARGKIKEALEEWRRALRLDPSLDTVREKFEAHQSKQ